MQDNLRDKVYDVRKTSDMVGRTWKAMENRNEGVNHLVVGTGIVAGDSKDLIS
jgi:hypothetical protein